MKRSHEPELTAERRKKEKERAQRQKEFIERRQEEKRRAQEILATKDVEFHKQLFDKIACLDGGRIEFDVETEGISADFVYSPYSFIGGAPFRIGCRKEGPQNHLVGYLFCNDNGAIPTEFSVKANVELKLGSAENPNGAYLHEKFSSSDTSRKWEISGYGYHPIPSNCIIRNGRFCVQADIKVLYCYKERNADATAPAAEPKDVTLVVGKKKFLHNKKYLAHFSEYFKVAFGSDFVEQSEKEIELKDINAKEFQNLLDLIAPSSSHQVKAGTVIGILRMVDFFDVEFARMKCVQFLSEAKAFSRSAKLVLSEQFRLPELQYSVFQDIGWETHLTCRLINSQDFESLSDTMQTLLLLMFLRQRYIIQPGVGFWLAPSHLNGAPPSYPSLPLLH